MRYLLLIRHSQSQAEPNVPARHWHLSEQGQSYCENLAKRVASYSPKQIITSREPKAVETGQLVANWLQLPCSIAEDLHEHERGNVPFLSQEEFFSSVKRFFDEPDQLVMGQETAEQASARFDAAVQSVLMENSDSLAIVAHGTVMSLFAAKHTNIDVYSLWGRLGMPAVLVFSLPEMALVEIVEHVDASPPSHSE